ncbi:site-specific tyrosine recombinase XerD [Nesterenkonia halophila]|uniref:site-specific tyrosine recombinase XerD n=1 Tax=Nesterenkonia halophila TaxID=302044 RepID=UPI001B8788DB|nr:site-specific tyrosine recombinase XerD [Nesterenkonia halophila]
MVDASTAEAPAADGAAGGSSAQEESRRRRRRLEQVPETPIGRQIGEYLTHLRIERGSSANTLASYRRDLTRYGAHLLDAGVEDPAAIDEGLVASFVQALNTGDDGGSPMAQSSIARTLAAVRGLHRWWALEGHTEDDPARHVSAPKPRQSLPKALTVEQVRRLLEAPNPATPLGLRDRALLEFLYATGARISEAVSLDVDDLHEVRATAGAEISGGGVADGPDGGAGERPGASDGLIVVRVTGKGDKQRVVPVGTFAQRAVGDYLSAGRPALVEATARRRSSSASSPAGSPALFLNARGGRLSRQSAWTILQRHAAVAEIDGEISPHTLRHSCATHMLSGGAGIRLVQEMLGHASVTTTQIYTKVTAESLQESYLAAHPRAR